MKETIFERNPLSPSYLIYNAMKFYRVHRILIKIGFECNQVSKEQTEGEELFYFNEVFRYPFYIFLNN